MAIKRMLCNYIRVSGYSSTASVLKIGDKLKKARVFACKDLVEFSKVSFDENPLHLDSELECVEPVNDHETGTPYTVFSDF
nr:hypothetical protein [Tanacetum cinerariifolium]